MKREYFKGSGRDVPPTWEQVSIYFAQQNRPASDAKEFYRRYEDGGWISPAGVKITNWKRLAWNWIWYKSRLQP